MTSEDDTYSSMFTALKHPIRRKILRILNQTPATYTEILNQLNIDNGLLNYHLDNMKDLITKNQEKYTLSEFGKAAMNLTERVEEAPRRNESIVGLKTIRLLAVLTLVLFIGVASLSGLYISLNNSYQNQSNALSQKNNELEAATQQLRNLSVFGELANVSEPATWSTSGTQIVKGFPMSCTYWEQGGNYTTLDEASSVIVFYNPTDGAITHLELAVDPVNVNSLELTLQRGNAWRNESWVKVGTVGEYFNLTNPSNPTINETVWQAPILWSLKTSGNGAYESPTLTRGWYTFSLFGPVIVQGPFISSSGGLSYIHYPSFIYAHNDPDNPASHLHSYKVIGDFTLRDDGKLAFFAASTDHS